MVNLWIVVSEYAQAMADMTRTGEGELGEVEISSPVYFRNAIMGMEGDKVS